MSERNLVQLLYHSRRAAGTTDQIVVDHVALLSAAKNRLLGVTGCLWYGPTRFVQILEGDARVVNGLFASIARDFRHHDVRTCLHAPIDARAFRDWSIAPMLGDETQAVASILTLYGVEPPAREEVPEPRTVIRRIAELLVPRDDAVHAAK